MPPKPKKTKKAGNETILFRLTYRKIANNCLIAVLRKPIVVTNHQNRISNYLSVIIATVLVVFCSFFGHSQDLGSIAQQKPFEIKGNIGTNFIGYNASGIDNRMQPFSALLASNATAYVYGMAIPFSVRLHNRNLDYSQPFNQVGLSPTYKWATAHIGYSSVNFSNFTLSGHRFLGGGVELKPGKFRFGLIYGRFKKATTAFQHAVDTAQSLTRRGFGAKIGIGSEQTYVDLVVLKIKDDSSSMIDPLSPAYLPSEENLVTGINTRIKLSKSLSFESEVAASIYTTDIKAVGFEGGDYEELLNKINKIVKLNLSTELLTAIRASLNLRLGKVNTKMEYRRIDPGYRSMGAYFMNNDLENLTISPSVSLFKRKLNLRGSIGVQHDNLRNTKRATSLRTISAIHASVNPWPVFGLDVSYSNYSSNQRPGRVPLIDSLKLYQATSNLNITPRLMFNGQKYNHMVMLVLSNMGLRDFNDYTRGHNENKALIANLTYSLNLVKLKANLMAGANYNRLENYLTTTTASGIMVGASKNLLKDRLNLGFNHAFIRMSYQEGNGSTHNTTLTSSYALAKQHAMRLNVYFINANYPDKELMPAFNEIKGDLSYVYTF